MEEKTNVMRILEQKKIKYTAHSYINTDAVSGVDVAAALNENPDKVFKTLVTVAKSGKNYVFVIPVAKELELKKAARAVGEKSIDMLKSKELLPLTGYIQCHNANKDHTYQRKCDLIHVTPYGFL